MSHSFNKLWIHAIWSTKDRQPIIKPNFEQIIFDYVVGQFVAFGCTVQEVNGMSDHIHCLFLLNPQKSVAEVIKQVKGSSSHFINHENLVPEKFSWQTGYAAFSVSESVLDKVSGYIQNQKEHHQKRTFQSEYNEFLKLYKLDG